MPSFTYERRKKYVSVIDAMFFGRGIIRARDAASARVVVAITRRAPVQTPQRRACVSTRTPPRA
jgi:hypothetical protein